MIIVIGLRRLTNMEKNLLKAKDLLLLLLYLPGTTSEINEPIKGKTRMTKMFFLFDRELYKRFNNFNITNMPEFFAYNYGPFSKELLDDIRFFCTMGFINEEILKEELSNPEIEEYYYDIIDDIGYGEQIDEYEPEIQSEINYSLTAKGLKYVKAKIYDKFSEEQIDLLSIFKHKINSLPLDAILEYVYNKYPESAEKSKIKEKYLKA